MLTSFFPKKDKFISLPIRMQPLWCLLHWRNYPSPVYTNQRTSDRKTNANGGDNTYGQATTQELHHRPKNYPHKNW